MKNKIFALYFFVFCSSCFGYEFSCKFKKKVEVMSEFDSQEIKNDIYEEKKEILKVINGSLKMKILSGSIEYKIKTGKTNSIIDFSIIKKSQVGLTGSSKRGNFVTYFDQKQGALFFLEFHDGSHHSSYFYKCKKH